MTAPLDLIRQGKELLEKGGIEHPRQEAEDLLAAALKTSRSGVYLSNTPSQEIQTLYFSWIARREKREPFAYIVGEVSFFHVHLKVDRRALIPRVETELLAEKAATLLAKENLKDKVLWDLGCGSGCLGIALKKQFPELAVVLIDLSQEALSLAEENARKNNVEVELIHSDYFEALEGRKFDFLISNPPYISEEEVEDLEPEVRRFEPIQALTPGLSGMESYRSFADTGPAYANQGAKFFFEIGFNQGKSVFDLFESRGFKQVALCKDLAGHDRFLTGEFP